MFTNEGNGIEREGLQVNSMEMATPAVNCVLGISLFWCKCNTHNSGWEIALNC